jgi:hypothetical protein
MKIHESPTEAKDRTTPGRSLDVCIRTDIEVKVSVRNFFLYPPAGWQRILLCCCFLVHSAACRLSNIGCRLAVQFFISEEGPTQVKVLLLGLKNFPGLWEASQCHDRLSSAGPKTNPDLYSFSSPF